MLNRCNSLAAVAFVAAWVGGEPVVWAQSAPAAPSPATRLDADYTGSLTGAVTGEIAFKAINSQLSGNFTGTTDGRAVTGKLTGTIATGAEPVLNATISGSAKAKAAPLPPATGGAAAAGTFPGAPFNGLQIIYSVSGVSLTGMVDREGFTTSRTYQIETTTGATVTVSGSAAPDGAACNTEYGSFWFDTIVQLQVGDKKAEFRTPPPCTQPSNAKQYGVSRAAPSFNLSVPVEKPGLAVSFSITQIYVNPRYGDRGLVVSGSKAAIPTAGDDTVSLQLTGKLTAKLTSKTKVAAFAGTVAGAVKDAKVEGQFTAKGTLCPAGQGKTGGCAEGEALVCPSKQGGYAAVGLMPAVQDARALIRFKGAPGSKWSAEAKLDLGNLPNSTAKVLLSTTPGDWRGEGAKYDRIDGLVADSEGKLVLLAIFKVINSHLKPNDALAKAGRMTVSFTEDGEKQPSVKAEIDVGLGAVVEVHTMAALGSVEEGEPHHAWRAYVKSAFHPDLDLAAYTENVRMCESSAVTRPVVRMHSWWVNDTGENGEAAAEEPFVDGVGGPGKYGTIRSGTDDWALNGVDLAFAKAKNGKTYLTPKEWGRPEHPSYTQDGDRLPAVRQTADGRFIKAYFGYLSIDGATGVIVGNQSTVEPKVLPGAVFVLTLDNGESAATSFACMLEPRGYGQLAFMMWAKLIPGFGTGVSIGETLFDGSCKLARGDYKGGFAKIGLGLGKEYLLHVVKERWLTKLSAQLTDGPADKVPSAVYFLVDIDPSAAAAGKQASEQWLKVMDMELNGAIDQLEQAVSPTVPVGEGEGAQPSASDLLKGKNLPMPSLQPNPTGSQGSTGSRSATPGGSNASQDFLRGTVPSGRQSQQPSRPPAGNSGSSGGSNSGVGADGKIQW